MLKINNKLPPQNPCTQWYVIVLLYLIIFYFLVIKNYTDIWQPTTEAARRNIVFYFYFIFFRNGLLCELISKIVIYYFSHGLDHLSTKELFRLHLDACLCLCLGGPWVSRCEWGLPEARVPDSEGGLSLPGHTRALLWRWCWGPLLCSGWDSEPKSRVIMQCVSDEWHKLNTLPSFLLVFQRSVCRGAGPSLRINRLKTLWYDRKATISLCCWPL